MSDSVVEFNPSCKLCKDLDLPEEEFLEIILRAKQRRIWACGSLHEFRQSAAEGCLLCSSIEQAVTYFADRAWKVYDSKFAHIDVHTTIPDGNCAEVAVELESCEKVGNMEQLEWKRHSGPPSCLPMPIDFELCRDKGSKLGWTMGEATEIHEDSSSDACMEMVTSWLETCRKDHSTCMPKLSTNVPTRILDVSQDSVRLYEPKGECLPYLTLSHCWGQKQIITTTKATEAERMQGINWCSLSKTFQDAVTITRKLGFRYLWIDSLCIIQDDKHDWEIESSRMASIYRGSQMTIAATSSPDGDGGCFSNRLDGDIDCIWTWQDSSKEERRSGARLPNAIFRPFNMELTHSKGQSQRFFARLPANHEPWNHYSSAENVERGHDIFELLGLTDIAVAQSYSNNLKNIFNISGVPLLRRAWAFQEKLLSPRILHFGPQELVWECNQALLCECSKLNASSWSYQRSAPSPRNALRVFCGEGSDSLTTFPHLQGPVRSWEKLISQYSQHNLKYETDRLPALSGIASMKQGKDKYLAGIWANDLPHGLFWTTDLLSGHAKRPEEYRAPSWAWPSMLGPIHFWPVKGLGNTNTVAKYLEGFCNPAGADPRGCVTDGYIKLKAPIIHSTVSRIYLRPDGVSTACEITFSEPHWWNVLKANDKSPRKSFRHTFTLDQSATSPNIASPLWDALEGSSQNYASKNTSRLSTTSHDSTEVAVGDHVSVLIVAYKTARVYQKSGGHGVWALALKRSDRIEESYQRIGIIWPILNGFPKIYERVARAESCDLFTETKSWFSHREESIVTIV